MTPWTDRSKKQPTATQRQTAIDITAEDLLPRLTVQHVADLVLLSMVSCCNIVTSLLHITIHWFSLKFTFDTVTSAC